jgi:hypothetical protein
MLLNKMQIYVVVVVAVSRSELIESDNADS